MKEAYAYFYVLGREERTLKNDIDTEQIVKEVLEGKGTLYERAHAAAVAAAQALKVDRKKKLWIDEYEAEIKDAGGDAEDAYQHYMDGRIEALAGELEEAAATDLADSFADDDDELDEEADDDEEEGDDKD